MAETTVILSLRGLWPQFSAMRSERILQQPKTANSPQDEVLQILRGMLHAAKFLLWNLFVRCVNLRKRRWCCLYKFSNVMKKYAYILLTSLIIFQTAVAVLSGHSIRYSLGPRTATIIMNSIETPAVAVVSVLRQTLSKLYRSVNSLSNTDQSFFAGRSDVYDHSSFRPLPNVLDKDHITSEREHLFLPVLDLVLLI